MKNISQNLIDDIVGGKIASLVWIYTKNGDTYAYTDHDTPLTVSGTTYIPAPALQHIKLVQTRSSETSTQEFASAWFDVPSDELLSGAFDDADIEVAICSWNNPGLGKVIAFKGNLSLIKWSEDGFQAEVSSYLKKLQKTIGAVFTPTCRHELFSQPTDANVGACGLSSTSYSVSGSITNVTSKWKFLTSNINANYTYGKITFTTGNNAGLTYEIKKAENNGAVTLVLGTAFTINVGDTYTAYYGCDKTMTTCQSRFNNVVNFGGFPHLRSDTNAIAI